MRALILAGGVGSRLWPLSSRELPKQFIQLDQNQTLLTKTLERFKGFESTVVTNETFAPMVKGDVIIEPVSKNTAFAICHAIKELLLRGVSLKEEVIVTPSDQSYRHFSIEIDPRGSIQLFGATPQFASSEYGYIEMKEDRVVRFIEKPHCALAQTLMESALWNSGMFAFSIETLLSELEQHAPRFFDYIEGRCSYEALPNLSIDKALIEKSGNLSCSKLTGDFRDLGTLDAFYDFLKKDKYQNASMGSHNVFDSSRNLIVAKSKPICLVDIDDHVVIETEDSIYIAPRTSYEKLKAFDKSSK